VEKLDICKEGRDVPSGSPSSPFEKEKKGLEPVLSLPKEDDEVILFFFPFQQEGN